MFIFRVDVIVASDIVFAKELHDCLSSLIRKNLVSILYYFLLSYFLNDVIMKRAEDLLENWYRENFRDLLEMCQYDFPAVYLACTIRADGMVKGFLQVSFPLFIINHVSKMYYKNLFFVSLLRRRACLLILFMRRITVLQMELYQVTNSFIQLK